MDAGWSRFAATLNIDLGVLPVSFLVLDRESVQNEKIPEISRVIGRIRNYKGFAKVLSCQTDGIRELTCLKRDAPNLLKELRRMPGSLYQWEREGDKIRSGIGVFRNHAEAS
jgi:hypothetical protein